MLLLCVFSWIATWHWITNWYALLRKDHLSHSQLISGVCSTFCRDKASWMFPSPVCHVLFVQLTCRQSHQWDFSGLCLVIFNAWPLSTVSLDCSISWNGKAVRVPWIMKGIEVVSYPEFHRRYFHFIILIIVSTYCLTVICSFICLFTHSLNSIILKFPLRPRNNNYDPSICQAA